jgi:hypothetical protein
VSGLVVLVVTGVALSYGVRSHSQSNTSLAARLAWARCSRCLLGDEPLDQEKPSERMRRIELGVNARKVSATSDPRDADWPRRCEPYTAALERAWVAARQAAGRGDDSAGGRSRMVQKVGDALRDGKSVLDDLGLGAEIDGLWGLAGELTGEVGAMNDVPLPPPPVDPIRLRDLTPIYPGSTYRWEGDWASEPIASRALRVRLVSSITGGQVCVFRAMGNAAGAPWRFRCHPISDSVPDADVHDVRLIGLEDAAEPLLSVRFSDSKAKLGGVYAVDSGARLVTADGYWGEAYGLANGRVAALDMLERDKDDEPVPEGETTDRPRQSLVSTLVRRLADGTSTRTVLDRPAAGKTVRDVLQIGEQILWCEGATKQPQELFAREIRWDDSAVGPVVDIGKLPANFDAGFSKTAIVPRLQATACRTSDALFVDLQRDWSLPGGSTNHAILVQIGGRWLPPLAPAAAGGRPSCQGKTLTYTWLRSGGKSEDEQGPVEVVQTRCTTERCETASRALPGWSLSPAALRTSGRWAVTGLGGKVLWVSVGWGVVLRLAPLAELARSAPTVIADAGDRMAGPIRLEARGDAAVLLVQSTHGADALRIDTNGKVTPIQAE